MILIREAEWARETEPVKMDIYKSIIVIIIETVEDNVSVRFFTSYGEPECSKVVLKSTR